MTTSKRNALISVFDKTGVVDLAQCFCRHNIGIISTGGTARHLRACNVPLRDVEEVTGFPEMMDGRVKTLHPKIHGGILYIRGNEAHKAKADEHNIETIDFVIVNLYPFSKIRKTDGVTVAELIENIDIGGPAMVRSAAKNHASVTVLTDPSSYEEAGRLLDGNGGTIPLKHRVHYALLAFVHTANYDTAIADWFQVYYRAILRA